MVNDRRHRALPSHRTVKRTSIAEGTEEELVAELLRCGCLSYADDDVPDKWRRAARILERHPGLARTDIYTACLTGEVELARSLLAAEPALASTPGGPQSWPPLLFVCYGRIPHPPAADQAVATATALLDCGASPDTYVLLNGRYRFSAVTGAIGRGEMRQPAHPRARELVLLLLARGANPNYSQALYNDMLEGDDDGWLRLLLAHGLTASDRINWESGTPLRLLDYLLGHAASKNHRRRAACLLEHGADPNVPDFYNRKSPYENALLAGNLEMADTLVRHGAAVTHLEGRDAFIAACARLDQEQARLLLAGHPEYLADVDPLIEAGERGRVDLVRLLVGLGMEADGVGSHGKRPLHVAAGSGSRETVELLLDHGADPMATVYGGTAAGWARHGGHLELARSIAERTRSPHDAALTGHVELLAELLASDASLAHRLDDHRNTPLHRLPDDLDRGRAMVEVLLRHGADPTARNQDGETAAELAEARGLDELADMLRTATP